MKNIGYGILLVLILSFYLEAQVYPDRVEIDFPLYKYEQNLIKLSELGLSGLTSQISFNVSNGAGHVLATRSPEIINLTAYNKDSLALKVYVSGKFQKTFLFKVIPLPPPGVMISNKPDGNAILGDVPVPMPSTLHINILKDTLSKKRVAPYWMYCAGVRVRQYRSGRFIAERFYPKGVLDFSSFVSRSGDKFFIHIFNVIRFKCVSELVPIKQKDFSFVVR